jgi:cellulose synthase/poly-beta-1,6-N-acetylglucosamine synthase-like glycosyltransferase
MSSLLLVPVAVLYFLVTGCLFLYGLNFLYVSFLALRTRVRSPQLKLPRRLPRVTVQLPIYNEMYVAERLVRAAANLDWPKHLLEIQVLDDSTDETVRIVARVVQEARKRGIRIRHVRRAVRAGYKAGALRDGFAKARGEFLAVFDADFVPTRNFLRRTVPHFQDPKVAFVQARWAHLNRDFSFLTLLQSLAIDAHFMVEQLARSRAGYWFNFNGTAGIWRRKAIQDAGGWRAETLAEDLDLSYRAFLRGWKAVYLGDLEAPAELPMTFVAFRRQQHRWARGSLECAIALLPKVWRSDFPLRSKIEATFHLAGYGVHLLLFVSSLLYPVVILMSRDFPELISLFRISYLFILTALAPTLLFAVAQFKLHRKWGRWLPLMFVITSFGAGMMLNTVRATFEILGGKPNEFKRTPKFGPSQKPGDWVKKKYHLQLDPIVYWELLLVAFDLVTISLGIRYGHWFAASYVALFAGGLLFTSLYTIWQTVQIQRVQLSRSPAANA